MADQTTAEKQAAAFIDENPYARSAESALSSLGGLHPHDEARGQIIGEAQALATLALAYEQRQTRFDLDGTLRDYLPGRVA